MPGLSLPVSIAWKRRHVLHKIGVVMLVLATLMFTAGFAIPAWTEHSGLWMTCIRGTSTCRANVFTLSNVWINVVRVTECLAMFSLILCMVTVVLQDFYMKGPPKTCVKMVEALAINAGICGIAGVVIFGIRWSSSHETVLETLQKKGDTTTSPTDDKSYLNWGFGLVAAASILALLSALTIGCGRCRNTQTPRSSRRTSKNQVPGLGRAFEEEISFRTHDSDGGMHDVDTSSMMLVPAGHFGSNKRAANSPRPCSMKGYAGKGSGDPPPPYAMPPPYPYTSNAEFFLPLANSSMMPYGAPGSSIAGDSSTGHVTDHEHTELPVTFASSTNHNLFTNSMNAGFLGRPTETGFIARPTESGFIATRTSGPHFRDMGTSSPTPMMNSEMSHHNRPSMRPLFVKTHEGGSVEITPSAQNSMALPSPFKHF